MKNTFKYSLLALMAVFVAAPAFAADATSPRMPTKGTKSYQASRPQPAPSATTEQQAAATETANPQDIAPAAGAMDEQKADKGFNLRDEMRLPRKN